jgi:hypothetical protein
MEGNAAIREEAEREVERGVIWEEMRKSLA